MVDDLLEILLEIFFDFAAEESVGLTPEKIPKWARALISLALISGITGVVILGIVLFKKSLLGGTLLILVGAALWICIIKKTRKNRG